MPNLAAYQDQLRASGHWTEFYVGFWLGAPVMTGTISATPLDGATSLSYTLATGSASDIKRGYRVVIKTSAGAVKGAWRVRNSGTISATQLPIRELSTATIPVVTGDRVEVWNVIQPGDKLVTADSSFAPDGEAYSNQNALLPPLANTGGHDIGFCDPGQNYRTVQFAGSLSQIVDADSAGTITHSWSAPTATGSTSSSAADPVFTFPPGEHVVTYTATDASNSAAWTTYRRVRVYDEADPPYECVLESLESDVETGTRARFRLFADADLATLYDGAMGAVFVREWFAGTNASYGSDTASRSHIKAIGYLRRDETRYEAVNGVGTLTFELISPLEMYRNVLNYSKLAERVATPVNWGELEDLSVWRMIVQIIRRYTWLTEAWDLIRHATFADQPYTLFTVDKADPITQALDLADAVDARVVCTRDGRFELQADPDLVPLAERAAITTTLTIDGRDYADFDLRREHWSPVEVVRANGFVAGTTSPLPTFFVKWPGQAPGEGIMNEAAERLIVGSITDAYERVGLRGARVNGTFTDADEVTHRAIEGDIRLPGSYLVFDPARCEYLAADIDDVYNLRELALDEHLLTVQSVMYTPDDDGAGETILTVRTATHGLPGVDDPQPEDGLPHIDINIDLIIPNPVVLPGSLVTLPEGAMPVKMLIQSPSAGEFYRVSSFDPTSSTLTADNIGAAITGSQFDGCDDPFDYRRQYVITADGLWLCNNAWGGSFALVASAMDIFGEASITRGRIQMSIGRRGYIAVSSGDKFACSFNYGATWTVTDFITYYTGISDHGVSSFVLSQRNNGGDENDGVLYLAYKAQGQRFGLPNDPVIWRHFKSTDWGRTWTLLANLNFNATFGNFQAYLHIPYTKPNGVPNANDANQWIYFHYSEGDAGPATTSRLSTSAGSVFNYSRTYSVFLMPMPRIPVCAQASHTTNGSYGYIVFGDASYTNIASTTDGWVSLFTGNQSSNATFNFIPFPTTANPTYLGVNGWGASPDIVLWWGNNIVRWTFDRGANWTQATLPCNGLKVKFDLSDFIAPVTS